MPRYNGGFIGTDGLDAPDPPTIDSVTADDQQLSIAFTAPTDTGTSAITGFVAQVASSGDNYSAGSNTGSSSPIVVSSLSNGTSYTAKVWAINAYGTSAPSDASDGVSPGLQRGIFAGGNRGSSTDVIQYVNIASAGNATDFGDLYAAGHDGAGFSSSTRGIFAGAYDSGGNYDDTIQYITIASTGNTTDFGDVSYDNIDSPRGCSNSTRGLFAGGNDRNNIDYVTIASTGNSQDFGDLTQNSYKGASAASSTRGIFYETNNGGTGSNTISYVTIASTGNASDFGDQTETRSRCAACSSATRALNGGGFGGSVRTNAVDYITIASTGNASDFGSLTVIRESLASCSSATTGIWAGGDNNVSDVIDQVTMASTGNATDFGDLLTAQRNHMSCSSAHGGLQ